MNHNKKYSQDRNRRSIGKSRLLTLALAAVLVTLLVAQTGMAQDDEPVRPLADAVPQAMLDDGGTPEFGIEWLTDWPGTDNDRAHWYDSAKGLSDELLDEGWVRRFFWGNTNAWERDFKRGALGGIEESMIDAVDLGLLATHGSSAWDSTWGRTLSSAIFNTNNDDWHISPGDAYRSLGNNDLEWIAFDSCSVLRDDSLAYWYTTFDGLHLMAGFANTMYVLPPGDGKLWGFYMRRHNFGFFTLGARTVTQAWFTGTDYVQPSGVRARVVAEVLDNYNDYIWNQGYVSPDPVYNGLGWYWDHVSGTPQPLAIQQLPDELPILKLGPPEVDEEYVKNIGQSFGLDSEIFKAPDGSAFYMFGGEEGERQLQVDTLSGGFYYQNLAELWTDPERRRTLPESPGEALDLTLSFLAQHDNLPGVWDFDKEIPPTVELESVIEMASPEKVVRQPLESHGQNYAVNFMRTVDLEEWKLSVVGPGSRQNVYLGDKGEVIGFKGGWRPILMDQIKDAVPIMHPDDAWEMFQKNPAVAVAQTPLADKYELSQKFEPTLGYYEQPSTQSQSELIPVWIFTADLYVETETPGRQTAELSLLAKEAKIYIPAADTENAMPVARIESPEDGVVVLSGESVDLAGSVVGGLAPHSFSWSSSVDGALGSGQKVPDVMLSPDVRGKAVSPNQVTLTVRDANGQTSTAAIDVFVLVRAAYLPVVIK